MGHLHFPSTLVVAGLVAAPVHAQAHHHGAQTPSPSAARLTSPATFENRSTSPGRVEVRLVASAQKLSLVPGRTSDAFTYNGSVPGPTLELREGDHVIVRFRNELPDSTTVHWHGLHLPFTSDGSPFHPVAPGEEYTYEFTVRPGSAGTYWYHPHPHHYTGVQVARGLYGAVIVRAADDPLPKSISEKLLILSDNRLLDDGAIDFPEPHSHHGRIDFENGREGDILFVNGQVRPAIDIRRGEVQRWRVINAAPGRVYRLALGGRTFLHVGTDGGLFERPVEVKEVMLAASERAELLVRGDGEPGDEIVVQSLPYDRYIPQTRPATWNEPRDLLTVRVSNAAPARPVPIPATLRHVPVIEESSATATRLVVLSQGMINGKLMDMNRIDVSAPLGATEIWEVENIVGMDHPFHLHGFQFQVLDRNGVPEPFRSWKDTMNVPRHSSARFIVRYENYPGKWMFHCHILDHEDHGMMGVLEVK